MRHGQMSCKPCPPWLPPRCRSSRWSWCAAWGSPRPSSRQTPWTWSRHSDLCGPRCWRAWSAWSWCRSPPGCCGRCGLNCSEDCLDWKKMIFKLFFWCRARAASSQIMLVMSGPSALYMDYIYISITWSLILHPVRDSIILRLSYCITNNLKECWAGLL